MWFCVPQSDSIYIKSTKKEGGQYAGMSVPTGLPRGGQYAGMSAVLTFAWSTGRNALVNTVRNQMVNGVRNLHNDEQRQAVTSEARQILVLAGAGSGKTKTLLQKIIYLIEEKGVSPASILAITFTKNAANEMIDRLIIGADNSGKYEKALFDKRSVPLQKRSSGKNTVASSNGSQD